MGLETLPVFPKTVPYGTLSAVFIGCGLILVFAGLVFGSLGNSPSYSLEYTVESSSDSSEVVP